MKVFSFCIYGTQRKYCQGLVENIESIQKYFPDFKVYIYAGNDVPQEYIDKYLSYTNVILEYIDKNTTAIKCYRFYPIDRDDISVVFSRDADSRITERDVGCINEFLNSDKIFHIIRDHYWHKSPIMAGLFGLKKGGLKDAIQNIYNEWIITHTHLINSYNIDEVFLEECIYSNINNNALIHTNICAYKDEEVTPIKYLMKDDADFMGNVYDPYPVFFYSTYPLASHIQWLFEKQRWDFIDTIVDSLNINAHNNKQEILNILYKVYVHTKNLDKLRYIVSLYKYTTITEDIIMNTNDVFQLMLDNGYKLIGTADCSREPNGDEKEIIIYYGNYYHAAYNLPGTSNKIYRHPSYLLNHHTVYEYDRCWDKIDKIYILNLECRRDRYMEILVELTRMNAPLHRIHHYKAKKETVTGDNKLDIYIGATKNHMDVTADFIKNEYEYCLIFEDDFTFTSNIEKHKRDLIEFFKREYEFDVCLISTSKFHTIENYDDLLSLTFQECTTSSGYILKKSTVNRVYECFETGYNKLIETGDGMYVCDRYWSKLQPDRRFYVFNEKMGYQRPTYSSITNTTNFTFD